MATKQGPLARRLVRGFDGLTLDPSPRLRATRIRLKRQDLVRLVWRESYQAVTQTIRLLGR